MNTGHFATPSDTRPFDSGTGSMLVIGLTVISLTVVMTAALTVAVAPILETVRALV